MDAIADLLFEACMLKKIPRSGFHFLGGGKESVAEHTFVTTFIGYVMGQLDPEVDRLRLMSLCLLHDLAETRIGDLNYLQKKYVTANEQQAVTHATRKLPFGENMAAVIDEFNQNETREARLARDADQLSLILELKALADTGHRSPDKWLPHARSRLKTGLGKEICTAIMSAQWDRWWLNNWVDSPGGKT